MKVFDLTMFFLSLVFAFIYALVYRKRFNVFITLIFAFVPIANLGYAIIALSKVLPEAIIGIKLTYIGGSYLNLFLVYTIFELSDINLKKIYKMLLMLSSTCLLIASFFIGYSPVFYKDITAELINGNLVLHKTYGPLHTVYYVQLIFFVLLCLGVNIYSARKKMSVSNKIIRWLVICELSSTFCFFIGKVLVKNVDLMPFGYVMCELILLFIMRRIALCDVTGSIIETIALNGETGFVSFNYEFEYLGSNALARKIFPALNELKVDTSAAKNPQIDLEIISNIKEYIINEKKDHFFKKFENKIYQIDIKRMYDEKKRMGYILYIQDDTKDQEYISLVNEYNDKLRKEVNEKTEHIVEMHDNLILGMATMVESRDNSTGGHIKRTSAIVNILIDEILKDKSSDALHLSAEFCHNIIKAAPMHDLGKIAVDDAVLRKPGRFTDEEFEIMKTHAAEGARIVHEILKGTDDMAFHLLAENVAHYHHERWDGSGYPEGLKGEEIPLEARIMAVADVYDALVSKRVYKEAMSFEKADSIMMESFGKHFDKKLEKYYVAARPQLEAYYSSEE